MSKVCSGVLRTNKGNDEQGAAERQKREIVHAQEVGGGHLARGGPRVLGAITHSPFYLSKEKALGWITTPQHVLSRLFKNLSKSAQRAFGVN